MGENLEEKIFLNLKENNLTLKETITVNLSLITDDGLYNLFDCIVQEMNRRKSNKTNEMKLVVECGFSENNLKTIHLLEAEELKQ